MKKALSLSLAFSLLAFGCSQRENGYLPTSQELRLNLHSEPPTLDPRKATDLTSVSVIKMCFEGLMRNGQGGEPELAAAEAMEVSEDGKLYVFTIRDAKWSDGTKVTAYDFEKTWKTILDPKFACEFAIEFYLIKNAKDAKAGLCPVEEVGVKAPDDKTLVIQLDHPSPCFLSMLTTHVFFPSPLHVIEKYENWTHQNYVGNGPFKISEWRHNDRIVLTKNLQYWDKAEVKLEKISLAMIEDGSTALSMYENYELDWAGHPLGSLPEDAIPALVKEGDLEKFDIAGTYYYVFNTQQFPFNNTNIRRAFTLALNREAIIQNITQSWQTPATGMVPPIMWKETIEYFHDHDVAEARRLFQMGLKELGIRADELGTITLSYNTLSAHHKIAQAIQQQWADALGVKVKLENKEWKVFLDELRQHKFQVARMGGVASINDPLTFLDYFRYLSSSGNYSRWTNQEFSEILGEVDQTADPEKRTALLKAAENLLIQEMPIAPIYYYTGVYLKRPYVKGIYPSLLNDIDFKWAYVETEN
ncbi:MAG: peptide ABC transporter substrate-binding protein [Chlamydiota bacterium]